MQYQNLRIQDIVDQHQDTGSQIMLPCAVWHTVAARHRTKTTNASVESLSRPPDDAHNKPYPLKNIDEE